MVCSLKMLPAGAVRRFHQAFSRPQSSATAAVTQIWQSKRDLVIAQAQRQQRRMSTEIASRLYENNEFHQQNGQTQTPPQEWTTYRGKLPILTEPEKLSTGVLGMYGDTPRTSVLMELTDRVGVLHDVLRYFWKYDVNICRIESRPVKHACPAGQLKAFDFFVDLEGSQSDENVGKLLDALRYVHDFVSFLIHYLHSHISLVYFVYPQPHDG